MTYKAFPWILIFLVSGCATTPTGTAEKTPLSTEYCGSFFLYSMCAMDYTHDGIVDAVYFRDSGEVFLYMENAEPLVKSKLPFHECAQAIDEPLSEASNRLLTINEQTGYFTELELKSDIVMHYMRYTDRVNKCNKEKGNIIVDTTPPENDSFDDFSYDEYDTDEYDTDE